MKHAFSRAIALLSDTAKRPLSLIWAALLLATVLLCAFLLTPATTAAPLSDEKSLESARTELAALEEKETLGAEEETNRLLYRISLEENAPLSRPYLFDAACDLVLLMQKEGQSERDVRDMELLRRVLAEKDLPSYLALIRERLLANSSLTREEALREYEEKSLSYTLTQNGEDLTPGESYTLRELRAIRLSLAQGKDLYRANKSGEELSSEDRLFLERLLTEKTALLLEKKIDPVPANRETLDGCEGLAVFVLFLFFLFFGVKRREEDPLSLLLALTLGTLLLLFLTAGLLTLATALAAPNALVPALGPLGRVPFFCALLCRLALRLLPPMVLVLSATAAARLTDRNVVFPLLAVLLYLICGAWNLLSPILALEESRLSLFSSALSLAFFPTDTAQLPPGPNPLFSFAFYLGLLALSTALLLKKKAPRGA